MLLTPRDKLRLSALELILQAQVKGHLSPLEMEQLKCALQVGETMRALTEYGSQVLSAPIHLTLHPFWQGHWVHLKPWKTGSRKAQLPPK